MTRKPKPIIKGIPAGFPIPASDFSQSLMDLNELVVEHPAATYFVQVQGHSMKNAGIFSDDILVVDRSVQYKTNSIVVAVVDGEFTVKKISTENGKKFLFAENTDYKPIELREGMNVEIWGVVTFVIHKV
ncbi:translesion error-prone DNA polymerase V autoproteolytic subunit [bacterium]|nr:translesion error-prone DNA polymerase V autoproteolytic subunit [bacterium]